MYQLTFEGRTVYDPRGANEIDKLVIRDPSIDLGVGRAGSVAFTVEHDYPCLELLTPMAGTLELTDDGVPIFRGRIIRDTEDFYRAHRIEAEGVLACLNDSIVPPYSFPSDYLDDADYRAAAESGNVVAFWLGKLIAAHNAQVGEAQRLILGEVTVTDPNNYIARSCESYSTTWEVISDKLSGSSLGGYLMIRYEADGNYVDYLADLPLTNVQTVKFAQNLIDLTDETYGGEYYTAILPIGADGLTIETMPDEALAGGHVKAGKLIYDADAEARIGGRITKVVTWDDVTLAENLERKADALLGAKGTTMPRTIECRACDLHGIDGETPGFRVGRYVRVYSPPHGLSAVYPLMDLKPNIFDPGATQITLGETTTFTRAVQRSITTAAAEAVKTAEVGVDGKIDSATQTTMERVTAIMQANEAVIIEALSGYVSADEYSSFRQDLAAQLAVMADQVSIDIARETESIRTVNNDLQAKYEAITKNYRFTEEGLLIGASDSDLVLRLDNGRLSFLDGGAEVAYISDRTMYITDAHFLASLRLGNFAFVPRDNGNLSFVKVSG